MKIYSLELNEQLDKWKVLMLNLVCLQNLNFNSKSWSLRAGSSHGIYTEKREENYVTGVNI